MSPSTTHRYMTTLLAVGLLEQDARSRRYRLPETV
jgi:DNA-binding IclR family transcriptional regulator